MDLERESHFSYFIFLRRDQVKSETLRKDGGDADVLFTFTLLSLLMCSPEKTTHIFPENQTSDQVTRLVRVAA